MASQLPLHDLHQRLGARFGEAEGVQCPRDYGDVAAEYAAVRERAGLIDRSHRGVIAVTGRDRATFLQGMLSSDVRALAPGEGCPAAFLDPHGKLVALLFVHCLGERFLLETDRSRAEPLRSGLDRLLFSEKVELEDVTGTSGMLTLAGPAARKTLETVLEQGIADLRFRGHAEVAWLDGRLRVVRDGTIGEEGYDVWGSPEGLRMLWERAVRAGVRPVGREAWNILRVEAGVVCHGVDVDASTLVMEAPLADHYSLDKGCYVGQEVVARVTYRGHVNRKIVGFAFPGGRVPPAGATVTVEGKEVGRITSAVVSPARGGLALGFLRREHWEAGTPVEAVTPEGERWPGTVATLPFHAREERRA
jgi:folate-binding protein YgfZ